MRLRIIDLGRLDGLRLTAAQDVPALVPGSAELTIVWGIPSDEHLSIGTHLAWSDRLGMRDDRFTYSRYSSKGGLMYYRGVLLLRAWADREALPPRELQQSLQQAAAQLVRSNVRTGARLHIDGYYVFLDGKKFAGISANDINGQSNCVLCINSEAIDFESLREQFPTKRFDEVRDLHELGLTPDAYRAWAEWLARGFSLTVEWSRFTPEEERAWAELIAVHRSEGWLESGLRDDLDCRGFYDRK